MTVVVCGYYGFGNLGDELILESVVNQLKKYKLNVVVMSASARQTAIQFGVECVNRWNPWAIVRIFFKSDTLLLGGGGLIQDQTSFYSPIYYLSVIIFAKLMGLQVMTLALSIENLNSPFNKLMTGVIFRNFVSYMTVRDQETKQKLEQWKIDCSKIHVVSDPVFALSPYALEGSLGTKTLMIPRMPCPPQGFRFLQQADSGCIIGLFFSKWEQELVQTSLIGKGALVIGIDSLVKARDIFSLANVVISARFHGLVLAVLTARPFVGMGDFHKVGRFCAEWGQPFLSWDASDQDIKTALSVARKNGPNPRMRDIKTYNVQGREAIDLIWKKITIKQ